MNATVSDRGVHAFRDSVGIRTRDPQLRRLLLYPAELRNHPLRAAKLVIFPEMANDYLGLKDSSNCVSWVTASEKPSCASEAGKRSSSVPFSWSMDRLSMPTAIIL